MRKLLLILLTLIVLTSCKTAKYNERTIVDSTEIGVPIINTKIEYRDRFIHDSVYVYDSIFTAIKGDTVYISKSKEINHFKNSVDTVLKVDTIQVPVEITKTMTKIETQVKEVNKLHWWQECFMNFGLIVFIASVVFTITKIKLKKFF